MRRLFYLFILLTAKLNLTGHTDQDLLKNFCPKILKLNQVAAYGKIALPGSVRIDKSEPLPDLSIRQEHRWQLGLKLGVTQLLKKSEPQA